MRIKERETRLIFHEHDDNDDDDDDDKLVLLNKPTAAAAHTALYRVFRTRCDGAQDIIMYINTQSLLTVSTRHLFFFRLMEQHVSA